MVTSMAPVAITTEAGTPDRGAVRFLDGLLS